MLVFLLLSIVNMDFIICVVFQNTFSKLKLEPVGHNLKAL